MNNKFVIQRRYLVLLDVTIIFWSFILACLLRFETTTGIVGNMARFDTLLWLSLIVRLPLYFTFGLYDRMWRYASMPDAIRIIQASLLSIVVIFAINFFVLPSAGLPYADSYSIFLLDGLLNLLYFGVSRFSLRFYNVWLRYRQDSKRKENLKNQKRTLIVGADEIGEVFVRQITGHPELGVRVVGFVDDNQAMHKMRIHNVPILGGFDLVPQIVRREKVNEVIIANAASKNGHTKAIEDWCRSVFISVKTASSISALYSDVVNQTHFSLSDSASPKQPPLVFQNLLITGGAGFIGANFVHHMLKAHPAYRIVVYDKLTYAGNLDNLHTLSDKYGDRFVFIKGDICDADLVAATMKEYQIDGIVNFAAETHVDRSLMTPGNFAFSNAYGVYVLLEQAKNFGVKRYHQISTDEVYGQILQGSFRETDPLDCRSPYSASKAGGDVMCLAYFTSFGLPITISRGSNNIGPFQHVEKVVPLFTTNAMDNLPLPVYGDGLYERDYQFVEDHCEGIDLILHQGQPGEVYNLGAGREMPAIDVAKKVCDLLGKPYSLIHFVEDRPGQDRRYSLDCTKVVALGWRPRHTTEQALEKAVLWYQENEWWWRKVKQGEYQEYYSLQYKERLQRATKAFPTPVPSSTDPDLPTVGLGRLKTA